MSKYVVVKRDGGSKEYGHNFNDCKILLETDDLAEAFSVASKHGYKTHETDWSGVRIFKDIEVSPQEQD